VSVVTPRRHTGEHVLMPGTAAADQHGASRLKCSALLQLSGSEAWNRRPCHSLPPQVSSCLLSHTQIFMGRECLVHSGLTEPDLSVEWMRGNKILD